MNIREIIQNYMRVLRIARKPTRDEFEGSTKICGLGIILVGIIGFVMFLLFWAIKLLQVMK